MSSRLSSRFPNKSFGIKAHCRGNGQKIIICIPSDRMTLNTCQLYNAPRFLQTHIPCWDAWANVRIKGFELRAPANLSQNCFGIIALLIHSRATLKKGATFSFHSEDHCQSQYPGAVTSCGSRPLDVSRTQ